MVLVLWAVIEILFSYRAIKVGDPEDPDNMLGAINTKEHYAKVSSHFFCKCIYRLHLS